jgi:predicted component of type VI protein secretion system
MLTEWAHKIGIYSEDRKYQNFAEHARNNLWDNGQAWNLGDMSKYQSTYNTLTDEEKNTIRDQFTSVYAQARLDGKDHTTAANEAAAAVS